MVRREFVCLSLLFHTTAAALWNVSNTKDMLPLLKQWLNLCSEKHKLCFSHSTRLPTRLLYIGEDRVRLCLGRYLVDTPKYATLSHCWGESKFRTLDMASLREFQEAIPQEALSKTFCDAIFIARGLGIFYLWIDSLCIIQDDPEDWRTESAPMSSVYGGSTLNIAASAARDGRVGCFFDRERSRACKVEAKTGSTGILSRPWSTSVRYDCIPYHYYNKSLAHLPLLRRG
jgi:hypothetical protein